MSMIVRVSVYQSLVAENARLKAEVERLQKQTLLSESPTWNAIGDYAEAKDENARLKAEVERLTTENDAVKIGHAEWKKIAIERGDEAAKDALLICRLEAEVKSLKKEAKKSK